MHALANETNIMKMGGLSKKIKITAWTFFMAWLAISGIPPFSGFFSKDEILAKAFAYHPAVWVFGAIGALLTAFYMSRLVFLTFFGKSRVEPELERHIHESPYVMTVPLMILAVLSVLGGLVGIPAVLGGSNHFEHFLEPVFRAGGESMQLHHLSHAVEYGLMAASVLVALAGIGLAYLMYIKKSISADALAEKYKGIYTLLYNKYYGDEFVMAAIVNPIINFSRWLWTFFDDKIIDGLVNLSARIMLLISLIIRRVQTGLVQNYAGVMVLGVLVILAYYLFA
jgi:NADH-quinone oxidoreductase subunit L